MVQRRYVNQPAMYIAQHGSLMIEADHLVKRYGPVTAVNDISFGLGQGRVIGVLGPNGAGKSTTLKMLIGYLPPTAGTARVAGLDVVRDPLKVRRCVGYLPESTPLSSEMRVREYLRFRADLAGLARRRRRSAIEAAIERCSLTEVARRPIRHLSKGYRQRVGLAAAIVHEPALLVLDEPTVGLDPSQIRDFRSLVRSLAGERTVLYSTHILAEAELACDDVLMIHGGRLAAQGSVEALLGGGPCRYRVVTDLQDAAGRLSALARVRNVEPAAVAEFQSPWNAFDLDLVPSESAPANDRDSAASNVAASEVAAAIVSGGGRIASLSRRRRTLEQVFVEVAGKTPAIEGGQ